MSRQCLIVRGGWPGHDPVAATDLFIPVLRRHGFVVDVEETPEVYSDDATMARYDLIVQCITMGSATVDEIDGLRRTVARGAGFAGWHGGIIDSFRNSTDYLQFVGAQFAAHPHAPEDRGHLDVEPYRDYTVRVQAPEHPIMDGVSDFDIRTEQYWVLTDNLIEVIADCELQPGDGDEWHAPVRMPVAWTREWGEGRIFVTSLGHTVDVLKRPEVARLIKRGMEWASR
ncbi:ThuA domain-containing protein [Demequina sp. NBRC 110053]|uniref:ThuA domain-containing protein n=1 Tax=Demequina sp. NBRC 110053 TaxID=1570342 RepID=UPI000A033293|nr:ThuA domain-containing protein [Demequina sp. NBRC 110053]